MIRCRKVCLGILAVLVTGIFSGCDNLKDVETTTISIGSKGAVTEAIVERMEGESFSAEELQSFVSEDVKSFNEKNGSEAIELKSCEIEKKVVRIVLEYGTCADYAAYHGTDLFWGTVEEAKAAGYNFDAEFKDNSGESAAASTILANDKGWQVVILEEPVNVKVSGDILYASANAEIAAKREAKIESGSGEEGTVTTDAPVYLIFK